MRPRRSPADESKSLNSSGDLSLPPTVITSISISSILAGVEPGSFWMTISLVTHRRQEACSRETSDVPWQCVARLSPRMVPTPKVLASRRVSVRGWTRSVVGLEFRRYQPAWPLAVAHEHGLARPELGEAAAPECFHMHKNIGRLGTAG